jgi:hypothetical protein
MCTSSRAIWELYKQIMSHTLRMEYELFLFSFDIRIEVITSIARPSIRSKRKVKLSL